MIRIFDDVERSDSSPAYDTEDSFHFLNRVSRPEWGRVRELVEEWFAEYPESSQADLRSRFRDNDIGQHYGAWWELYVYTLYRRLGYQVSIHPVLTSTSRQPDFLVTRGDWSMYVECVVYLSVAGPVNGQAAGERSWIFKATNQARNPNFMVDIDIRRAGAERPKASEIVRPLEEWLSSLDPDKVSDQISAGMGVPELVLDDVRGWSIEYGAYPVKPEHRGEEGRLIGTYPMTGAFINDEMLRLRDIVKRKGRHYGVPDIPFMVAVLNTSGFVTDGEVTEALFGTEAVEYIPGDRSSVRRVRQRDGYWRLGPPKRGSRVSAVLLGENIYPWRVVAEMPKLWINPWADLPLSDALPMQTYTAHDTGEVYEARTGTLPNSLFGLSTDWPGFSR
jgi:hypothetical protein